MPSNLHQPVDGTSCTKPACLSRVRHGVLAVSLLVALAACQRDTTMTSGTAGAHSATLLTGTDGLERLQVVLVADSAGYAMAEEVRASLRELMTGDSLFGKVAAVRFVVNERVAGNDGEPAVVPTASYELSMADILRVDLVHGTPFDIMNFAHDMTITHPAAVADIRVLCDRAAARYAKTFCANAQRAASAFEASTSRPPRA